MIHSIDKYKTMSSSKRSLAKINSDESSSKKPKLSNIFKITSPDPKILSLAAKIIKKNGIVAIKTDTLYGICCLATNDSSVEKLYEIKNE